MEDKQYFASLRSGLRRIWMKIGVNRKESLLRHRRPYIGKNPRQKWEIQCQHCKEWFMQKEIQSDHRTPCGSLTETRHIQGFVERLFWGYCDPVCKECHKIKTNEERANRESK